MSQLTYENFQSRISGIQENVSYQSVSDLLNALSEDIASEGVYDAIPHPVKKNLGRLLGNLEALENGNLDFEDAAEKIMDRLEIIGGSVSDGTLEKTLAVYVDVFDVDVPAKIDRREDLSAPLTSAVPMSFAHTSTSLEGGASIKDQWVDAGAALKVSKLGGPEYDATLVDRPRDGLGYVWVQYTGDAPPGYEAGTNYMTHEREISIP